MQACDGEVVIVLISARLWCIAGCYGFWCLPCLYGVSWILSWQACCDVVSLCKLASLRTLLSFISIRAKIVSRAIECCSKTCRTLSQDLHAS